MKAKVDVLVIGAGPAGCSAAALIRKAGFSVVVVEKESFPRFVIGESLLPRCMDLLDEAGLLQAVQERGYLVKTGAVFLQEERVSHFSFADQFSSGWEYTWQVPRDDFDLTLARAVEAMGVKIHWQQKVTDVAFSDTGAVATLRGQAGETDQIEAGFVLDASGYGRVLAGVLDLETPPALLERHALFTQVTGDIRPEGDAEGHIWICMLPEEAWLWVIPFSNGRTSVGAVARPEFFDRFEGNTEEKLRAIIATESNAFKRLGKTDFAFKPRVIHGYSAAVTRLYGEHYALVGNASEFLDPVFSSGVTLALESASLAANTLIRQLRGETVDWQSDYADPLMAGVDTFRVYVDAWYNNKLPTIFFNSKQAPTLRKQICSVLAGYVWDEDNACVTQPERAIENLYKASLIMS